MNRVGGFPVIFDKFAPDMKYLRILSIDGGGMRGIVPAVLLCKLEEYIRAKNPKLRIGDCFDLVAGTSTGGIVASGLLAPGRTKYEPWRYDACELVDLYRKWGPVIFRNTRFNKARTVFGLRKSRYPAEGINQTMEAYFGNLSLSQLKKPTLIPAFDVERRKAYFFTSHDARKDLNQDFYLRDVVRATTAAPTYFEPATIYSLADFHSRRRMTMIDGGIFANNPALCAYAEARGHPYFRKLMHTRIKASNMLILSLGTGTSNIFYPPEEIREWGLMQWSRPLVSMMMGGMAQTVDFQLEQVFSAVEAHDRYVRIDSRLPDYISPFMDDASEKNIDNLVEYAQNLSEQPETAAKFKHIVRLIMND